MATRIFQKQYPQGPKQYRVTTLELTGTATLITEKAQNGSVYAVVAQPFDTIEEAKAARKALQKQLLNQRGYARVGALA